MSLFQPVRAMCSQSPWIALTASIGLLAGCQTTRPIRPAATLPTTQPASSQATTQSPYARWEKEIAEYEAADRQQMPAKGGIVFIGSSTIRLWKTLASDFPEHNVINRGFGGSQIDDSVHFADRVIIPYAPRLVVLNAGSNDIAAGKSPQTVFNDFQRFVETVRAALPKTRVAYLAIQPAPSRAQQMPQQRETNHLISRWISQQNARGGNFDYIEVFDQYLDATGQPDPQYYVADRLHGNEAGYRIRAAVVKPHLAPNYVPSVRPSTQPSAPPSSRPSTQPRV